MHVNICTFFLLVNQASKLPSQLSTIPAGAEGAGAEAEAEERRGAAKPQGAGGSERVALNLVRRCCPHMYLL
jgi:hypothetical protein